MGAVLGAGRRAHRERGDRGGEGQKAGVGERRGPAGSPVAIELRAPARAPRRPGRSCSSGTAKPAQQLRQDLLAD